MFCDEDIKVVKKTSEQEPVAQMDENTAVMKPSIKTTILFQEVEIKQSFHCLSFGAAKILADRNILLNLFTHKK